MGAGARRVKNNILPDEQGVRGRGCAQGLCGGAPLAVLALVELKFGPWYHYGNKTCPAERGRRPRPTLIFATAVAVGHEILDFPRPVAHILIQVQRAPRAAFRSRDSDLPTWPARPHEGANRD
jgi:hypothetical protein